MLPKLIEVPLAPSMEIEEGNVPRLAGVNAPPEEKARGEPKLARLRPERELPAG
jgi:hypothetical protein